VYGTPQAGCRARSSLYALRKTASDTVDIEGLPFPPL
jgi:hypothetical protein